MAGGQADPWVRHGCVTSRAAGAGARARWCPSPPKRIVRPPEPPGEWSTAWARTPLAVGVRAAIQAAGLKPLVWSEVRPQVRGSDNLVGLDGPVIFTANHSSHLDAPLILCSLPPAWRRAHAGHGRRGLFLRRLVARHRHGSRLRHRPAGPPRRPPRRRPRPRVSCSTPAGTCVIFPEGTRVGRRSARLVQERHRPPRHVRRRSRSCRSACAGRSPRCPAAGAGRWRAASRSASASAHRCACVRTRTPST